MDAERSAYNRAHYRVKKLWGNAAQYPCISCGAPARDWAYDGTDPASFGAVKWKCSQYPEFYMPMCRTCHLGMDRDLIGRFASRPKTTSLTCSKCDKKPFSQGLCRMHYDRVRRYGATGPQGKIGKHASFEDRFINHVQVYGPTPTFSPQLGPCAVWTGYRHESGYGAIWRGHRLLYVHRVAWEMAHGPLRSYAVVHQVCLNRLCVRLDHLDLID